MPADKKSSKEKTKKLPKEALLLGEKSEKEQRHYFGVLLEDVQEKMSRVIETTELTRDELKRDMQSMEERLTDRIETVEMVVRSHSTQLQSQSVQIQQLDKKIDGVEQRLTQRMERVEQKLDGVIEKVEQHDKDIVILKAEVFPG